MWIKPVQKLPRGKANTSSRLCTESEKYENPIFHLKWRVGKEYRELAEYIESLHRILLLPLLLHCTVLHLDSHHAIKLIDISSSYLLCLVVTVISLAYINELHHLGMTASLSVLFWPAKTEMSASNLVDSTRATPSRAMPRRYSSFISAMNNSQSCLANDNFWP